jgi:type I restriction enzyme S subunit
MSVTAAVEHEPGLRSDAAMPVGYNRTALGVLPEGWAVDKLQQFWSVIDCKHVTAEFVDDGVPVASIAEVQSRFVNLDNAKQTTLAFYALLTGGQRRPAAGDLIVSRNATVGQVAQVAEWHPPFAMGQDVCLLRKRKTAYSTDFLQSIIQSRIVSNQLQDFMVGSTFRRVNIRQIKALVIPMPQPEEQRAIAEALSDVDRLIGALDNLIAKKRAIKLATMQQLLTRKTRLTGFRREWERKPLKLIAPLQRGFDLPTYRISPGPYPVIYSNGVLNHHSSYMVKGPGVITGRSGTIGKVSFIEQSFWPHNTSLWVTSFGGNNPRFVFYLYSLIGFERFGTGSGVPTLNRNDVHAHEVMLPADPEEQSAIANVLSDTDSEITALERRRDKTKAIKQGMMQSLLTGRIRLVKPGAQE